MTTLLALTDVHKCFGSLKVTDGISLSVNQGEVLGILGPNGAGKTTLFNLISGDIRPDSGVITFKGTNISGLPAHKRCRLGIGRSYQVPQPYSGLTVFENCLVAATLGARLPEPQAYALCQEVLQSTGLLAKANQLAGGLTLLNRKRLELARALCTQPKLLLLDEIAGGLTEHEAKILVDEIKAIKARGVTMIWIEHVVHALLAVADRLFVLNFGTRLAEGEPNEVMNNPEVKRVYMGLDA
ncbi:ABC transporter ATP-binding protein [Neopusillimonas aromaticivorans]|uniref:ABC transporter ATP-binding protein n=1 Tax=Neopusillimonas aromaticivorans TaxID=2979868 RepID=UPI00259300FE|nr:ABC transporter ATP-binding protein [Neopusillimonas aromaticivorans]WJJ92689.1 ABC transporter ATP-binding protein [Neopusillimonas aromaticivorans]